MAKKTIICKHCNKEGQSQGRGLCIKCYAKLKNEGRIEEYPRLTKPYEHELCKVEGCNNKNKAFGYCKKHYDQITKYGYTKERNKYDPNEIIINKELNYAEIVLYNNDCKEIARALIDIEDIERVEEYKWSPGNKNYVHTTLNNKRITLHRFILNVHNDKVTNQNIVDHINRNPLDNRKDNLRIVTNKENAINSSIGKNNTSGIIGVSYEKTMNKWRCYIKLNDDLLILGSYENKEEAIKMRLSAELKYFGIEFAPQRHLFDEYGINEDSTLNVIEYIKKATTNKQGKSGIKGISYKENKNRWKIETSFNGKRYYLGMFKTFEEAVKTKLLFELEYYGKEEAPNKHLFEEYGII